ncbi:siderophore-interacting protein [Nonomuraea longispora]|uniref:siderophore-interacting protein n=1 Tax=Nonomuraea longispora TaxID=1848320 RepID=UPI001FE64C93|nr:siderophore-interacting protein [Nonomuraea longispora]
MARTMRDRLFGKYAMEGTVTVAEQVTSAMRRIRLETSQPVAFPYTPGQPVRIQLKDPLSVLGLLRPADTLRTYTIWDLDPARTAIELRIHLYDGDGIGLTWARAARPRNRVTFW